MDFELPLLLLRYAAAFAVLGVLDTLLAAGAFRVNLGAAEFPMEPGEFWQRSAVAGFVLAAGVLVAAFVSLVLFKHAYGLFGILMLGYAVGAVFLYNWTYALDDLLEAFKIFVLHHALPAVVLIACFVFASKGLDAFVRFVLPT